jgi:hypothetical protein
MRQNDTTRFVWFWNFWHWSRESFRVEILLRDPLHGFAGNWLAWHSRAAGPDDLAAIDTIGHDERAQRAFIRWIVQRWAIEADPAGNRILARFIITQLAAIAPFTEWRVFGKYRTGYGCASVSAVVLAQGSDGEEDDVREVEALVLPDFSSGCGPKIICEGFQADEGELGAARDAAILLLGGKNLAKLFMTWVLFSERPRPRLLARIRALGWLSVAGLICFLRFGPDPGDYLKSVAAALVTLFIGLAGMGVVSGAIEALRLRREGKVLGVALGAGRVRLRMSGGLIVKGGSAGLAFSLNILLAVRRAHPGRRRQSSIWQSLFHQLRHNGTCWAATGVIGPHGGVTTVVLEPKLRACLQTGRLQNILTPHQSEAHPEILSKVYLLLQRMKPTAGDGLVHRRIGYATGRTPPLQLHRCNHLIDAVRAITASTSRFQVIFSAVTVVCTLLLAIASKDLVFLFIPPPPPEITTLSSPADRSLRLRIDTRHSDYYGLVLESEYWVNRNAEVQRGEGTIPSAIADIPLVRASQAVVGHERDGTIWLERRARFLGRDFQQRDRVNHFTLSSLTPIPR